MTKIGCFEYSGGVGEWFVNMLNTHVSFLFNIINVIGYKLVCKMSVGKLSHSAPYTQ